MGRVDFDDTTDGISETVDICPAAFCRYAFSLERGHFDKVEVLPVGRKGQARRFAQWCEAARCRHASTALMLTVASASFVMYSSPP